MDNTLAQILSHLLQLQVEHQQLKQEYERLKQETANPPASSATN